MITTCKSNTQKGICKEKVFGFEKSPEVPFVTDQETDLKNNAQHKIIQSIPNSLETVCPQNSRNPSHLLHPSLRLPHRLRSPHRRFSASANAGAVHHRKILRYQDRRLILKKKNRQLD